MAYTGNSIVDYLSSTGAASDYASRAKLAASKGINGYSGTADQNTQLLNMLRGGSTPAVPSLSAAPVPSPYVAPPSTMQTTTTPTTVKPTVPTATPYTAPVFSAAPTPAGSPALPSMSMQTTTPATNIPNAPIAGNSGSAATPTSLSLTRNLTPGSQGDDVKQLQQFLISKGYNIAAGATGYYGDQTKAAVAQWQQENGMQVDPSEAGYFGPKSRALLGGASPTPANTQTGTPAVPTATDGTGNGAFGGNATDPTGGNGAVPPPQITNNTASANVTDNDLLKNILSSMVPTSTELDLQNKLANMEASRKLSYQDIEGNPVATPFMTGQEAAIDKTVNNNEQTVQDKLKIEQAKRQSSIDANKTALDYSLQKQNIYKPFATGYGSSVYDPTTGKMTASNDVGANSLITQAIQNGQLTPDMLSKYGSSAILQTLQNDPGYNFITGKAGANFATNVDTQKFIANSNTALNTINDPAQGIIALSNKVNRGNVTVLNNGQLALKSGVSDPATATFIQQANILADEVSKLLGSGAGSDFAIQLGQQLVNPSYSQEAFNATMQNLAGRIQNKVNEYKAQGSQGNQTGGGSSAFSGDAWQ